MSDFASDSMETRGLAVLATVAGVDGASLKPEQNLVGDLAIDSVKALQLVMRLEDELGVEISDDQAAKMDTVGDVIAYLRALS